MFNCLNVWLRTSISLFWPRLAAALPKNTQHPLKLRFNQVVYYPFRKIFNTVNEITNFNQHEFDHNRHHNPHLSTIILLGTMSHTHLSIVLYPRWTLPTRPRKGSIQSLYDQDSQRRYPTPYIINTPRKIKLTPENDFYTLINES